jgi:uncharacterized membrane protein YidH (DUF202 family)
MATVVSSAAAGRPLPDEGTRLSLTRTRLSAERTLMSIRTSFAMISFGVTIGKFLEYLSKLPGTGARSGDLRTIPTLLIPPGLVSLFAGVFKFRHTTAKLAALSGTWHRPTALGIIAVLVGLLGVLAFAGLFVRVNLF